MQKTKIIWKNPAEKWQLDYTLNPIVGCKMGCSYCYAKRLNDRFKWIPDWKDPQFYPERLNELAKIKKPSTIFMGSMSDMFGKWIDSKWILKILDEIEQYPQHRFMFLTKTPARYSCFIFPENCWLGTTVESFKKENRIHELLCTNVNNTFLSVEPLMSDMSDVNFSLIDLVIVGKDSSPGAKEPNPEWIKSIKHDNIFLKPNLK